MKAAKTEWISEDLSKRYFPTSSTKRVVEFLKREKIFHAINWNVIRNGHHVIVLKNSDLKADDNLIEDILNDMY